jgi:predicted secreted protein
MPTVRMPDGAVVRFPDDMPPEQIRSLIAKKFPGLETPKASMGVADIASGAVKNLVPSAVQFGKDVAQPILHPIETAKSLGNVIAGGAQKLIPGEQSQEPYADAVGQFFADRYGGMENFKKTMATDPVGFAADLSILLSGGGMAAARLPGVAGKVGQVVKSAGSAVDPINAAGKAIGGAGHAASELVGGLGTHTGGQSIRTAAGAGYQGGARGRAFQEQLRGDVPMEDVVSDAKYALGNIRQQRGQQYRAGMAGVAANQTPLNFNAIDQAVANAGSVKNFKGVNISPSTGQVWQKISDAVTQWRGLDPAKFHTAEGFDALKQYIGDIRDSTQYGTPERVVADKVYNSVKGEIVKQAPQYAKVMKDYEQASTLIKEMEKTLSLNPKASIDTSLRKLQSVMRNNANTNYGKRLDLAEMLKNAGAPHLMEKLAGQALNTFTPRGLGKIVAGGTIAAPVALTQSLLSVLDPSVLAILASQSPRLMGEAAFYTGKAAKGISSAKPRATGAGLYQSGRLEDQVGY